jgi:hypothetical protein
VSEWSVYFYLEGLRRDNCIRKWLEREGISSAQIAVFQDKLDTLEESGPELLPGFISETPVAKDILKMKIKGNKGWKQLRPMCCRGPFGRNEITILCGAVEKDGKLIPGAVKERAQENLKFLKLDPTRRVRERLTGKPKI